MSIVSRPARLSSHVSRLHLQLGGIEKFVDGLKSAGVEFSAGETDDGNQLLHHFYSTNGVRPSGAIGTLTGQCFVPQYLSILTNWIVSLPLLAIY